jgi:hypothetical protein
MTKKEMELREVLAAVVRCTRHIRNFPHPKLTIEQIRREATIAEQRVQTYLGEKEWDEINDIAFKD